MAKKTKRADGRYAVQIYLGEIDGKRKYKTVYGTTQKEANEKADEVRAALRKGLDISAARDTFGAWANRWESIHAREVSAGAMTAYTGALRQLEPLFPLPITKVRAYDIQQIIYDCASVHPSTGHPAAKRTLQVIRSTAKQIFDLAIENRVLDFNPASNLRIPAAAPEETRRALTDEEQGWIIHTPHRARRAAMIMMFAGLRRGELIPLTWRDIDLLARTIRIDKSVEMVHGQSRAKSGGKTYSSTRTVDIPQILADFLQEEYAADTAATGTVPLGTLVCPAAKGQMHNMSSWRRMWESYLKELNFRHGKFMVPPKSKMQPGGVPMVIPPISAHWLRHTFATMLYLSGVDVLTAKEQLGHSDIKTTLEIYTHLDTAHKRKNISKLDSYLAQKSACKSDASHTG